MVFFYGIVIAKLNGAKIIIYSQNKIHDDFLTYEQYTIIFVNYLIQRLCLL